MSKPPRNPQSPESPFPGPPPTWPPPKTGTPEAQPELLYEGTQDLPLIVVRGRFWNYQSIAVFDGPEAAVIDPGMLPEDIALLADRARHAATTTPRSITHQVLTHDHHDHIRGWTHFPQARLHFPELSASRSEGYRRRTLAFQHKLDRRFGLPQLSPTPPSPWPRPDHLIRGRTVLKVGRLTVDIRGLPGHSDDTSIVLLPEIRTLLSTDYLVAPTLPYCRHHPHLHERALDQLETWVDEFDLERVIPAHNHILEGRPAILAAIQTERAALQLLRSSLRSHPRSPGTPQNAIDQAVASLRATRPHRDPRDRQDADNAARILREELGLDPNPHPGPAPVPQSWPPS